LYGLSKSYINKALIKKERKKQKISEKRDSDGPLEAKNHATFIL
jgi:hypothetical protein